MEKNLGFVESGSVFPKIAYTVCRLQVYERVGVSVISVCGTTQKGHKMPFMFVKKLRKRSGSGFVINSCSLSRKFIYRCVVLCQLKETSIMVYYHASSS